MQFSKDAMTQEEFNSDMRWFVAGLLRFLERNSNRKLVLPPDPALGGWLEVLETALVSEEAVPLRTLLAGLKQTILHDAVPDLPRAVLDDAAERVRASYCPTERELSLQGRDWVHVVECLADAVRIGDESLTRVWGRRVILVYPCPACGFLVFEEPPGSYDICRICGWEDDHVQMVHPSLRGGANRESLQEAQVRALHQHPLELKIFRGFHRDHEWRPLTEDDVSRTGEGSPRTGIDYFNAAAEARPVYYWRRYH